MNIGRAGCICLCLGICMCVYIVVGIECEYIGGKGFCL